MIAVCDKEQVHGGVEHTVAAVARKGLYWADKSQWLGWCSVLV